MAIDYREQWAKFRAECGRYYIVFDPKDVIEPTCKLGNIMDTWMRNVNLNRERLMREYLMEKMRTDINGGDKVCYHVRIVFRGDTYINVKMVKADFDAWCKKKGGK